ncbi:glycoside hydrolase [Colletotrichum kahawae]|uniref:Carboxylic ester hydrolase n=1 Tax=Colletotrichum kahawae TaxID=34407 RepID=A0AAD9YL78_COLKA|nr:glycoside hydrolase [Colletotrichum kahawae]
MECVGASGVAARSRLNCGTTSALVFDTEFLEWMSQAGDPYFQVPKGWTYSQPALDVQNATFCNVTVTYSHTTQDDNIIVEAWLPTEENYNGRLQAVGGGGWTPGRFILSYAAMINAIASGYATVTTDAGIPTAQNPTDWLLKSPGVLDTNALQNFGQVAMKDEASCHREAAYLILLRPRATVLLLEWLLSRRRMGMKVAQQYPDVYDGIMAAAPALNWAEFYINSIWPSFYMENTQQFPRDCELNALTTLGIAACDSLDGVKDGLISDPEACRATFDPFGHVGDSFFCSTNNKTLKITQAAAAVANASWTGPRFSNGKFLYDGYEIGSDLSVIAPTDCTGEVCTSAGRANILFPWQAFVMKDPSATLPNITDGTFDTIYRAVKLAFASNMETEEADLRDFRDAGGKLMTYHGLADQSISPGGTLRYYNKVADFVGNVTSFYKYYRVPGLKHCWGGNGGQPEQMFSQLRAWVENGTEPQSSPVVVTTSDNTAQQQILCPYPQKAIMNASCASANSTLCWSCSESWF